MSRIVCLGFALAFGFLGLHPSSLPKKKSLTTKTKASGLDQLPSYVRFLSSEISGIISQQGKEENLCSTSVQEAITVNEEKLQAGRKPVNAVSSCQGAKWILKALAAESWQSRDLGVYYVLYALEDLNIQSFQPAKLLLVVWELCCELNYQYRPQTLL